MAKTVMKSMKAAAKVMQRKAARKAAAKVMQRKAASREAAKVLQQKKETLTAMKARKNKVKKERASGSKEKPNVQKKRKEPASGSRDKPKVQKVRKVQQSVAGKSMARPCVVTPGPIVPNEVGNPVQLPGEGNRLLFGNRLEAGSRTGASSWEFNVVTYLMAEDWVKVQIARAYERWSRLNPDRLVTPSYFAVSWLIDKVRKGDFDSFLSMVGLTPEID